MNNLVTVFENLAATGTKIVELQNKDHIPTAALYLDKLNLQNVAICETNTSEKYYLYLDGVAVFFSYYHKMEN